MAEGSHFARQSKPRGVDEAQQVERQSGVFLEQVFDLAGVRLFAHQVDELNDGGLRRADGGGFDQGGLGKPEALEQFHAQVRHHLELFGGFHLFSH